MKNGTAQYRVSKWVYVDKETEMGLVFIDQLNFTDAAVAPIEFSEPDEDFEVKALSSNDSCKYAVIVGTGTNGNGVMSDTFKAIETFHRPLNNSLYFGCEEASHRSGSKGYHC